MSKDRYVEIVPGLYAEVLVDHAGRPLKSSSPIEFVESVGRLNLRLYEEQREPDMCRATTKSGERCRRRPQAEGFCRQHLWRPAFAGEFGPPPQRRID